MKMAQVHRLVFASTAAVYGEVKVPVVTESQSTVPMNPYGQTKLQAEKAILTFSKDHPEFSFLIFRFFNVAGSWPEFGLGPTDPAPTQLVRRACRALVGTGPALNVFGTDYPTPDGSCIRDYIHIKDLTYALSEGIRGLSHRPLNEILNLGYGSGLSVLEIISSIEKITGRKVPHTLNGRRAGDPAAVVADPARALRILNLKWRHNTLEEICRDSIWWEEKLLAEQKN
jgi:UDP-glucose 4-epimerase